MTAIHRADTVGSLLRPTYLKDARGAWMSGNLPTDEFKRLEDRAVDEAIALQEDAGLDVVTDGEMRRLVFVDALGDAIDGISPVPSPACRWHGPNPEDDRDFQIPVCVTGKIRRRRSVSSEEFTYAREKTSKLLKVTIPSPMMPSLLWSPEHSTAAYRDPFQLFADAVEILQQEVRDLAALGCRYVQVDAPELATLVDPSQRHGIYESRGIQPERMLGEGIEMLNAVADAPGVTFGLHLCRGNNEGQWLSQGGYEVISQQVFKRAAKYDIFLLEYDDRRSGSFEPLTDVPRDKAVVLGLVSTKSAQIETVDELIARINDASRYFPLAQLALSTQCGFASVFTGNPISEAVQRAKLQRVAEIARRVWA